MSYSIVFAVAVFVAAVIMTSVAARSATAVLTGIRLSGRNRYAINKQRAQARLRVRLASASAALWGLLARFCARPLAYLNDVVIDQRIAAAGLSAVLTSRGVVVARACCASAGIGIALRVIAVAPGKTGPLLLVAIAAGAAAVPDLWLRARARRRSAEFIRGLPDALDLLRAAVAAGMPLARALAAVADHCNDLVGREFDVIASESALGVPLAVSLASMERRNALAPVTSLVASVAQAARHGVPLAETLAAQSSDARAEANRRVALAAARAAPQIQLIVSVLLVPAGLLVMGAVVVAAVANGDLTVF